MLQGNIGQLFFPKIENLLKGDGNDEEPDTF